MRSARSIKTKAIPWSIAFASSLRASAGADVFSPYAICMNPERKKIVNTIATYALMVNQ